LTDPNVEPTAFHTVAPLADLADGLARKFLIDGWPLVVAHVGDQVHAVLDRCTHAASRFSAGRVRRGAISCPLHGAMFDLVSGRCVSGVYSPIRTFETRVRAGVVEVGLPKRRPRYDEIPVS
jgi:nitrite reductase/ring-hydroxylating ferredoxin subunit